MPKSRVVYECPICHAPIYKETDLIRHGHKSHAVTLKPSQCVKKDSSSTTVTE